MKKRKRKRQPLKTMKQKSKIRLNRPRKTMRCASTPGKTGRPKMPRKKIQILIKCEPRLRKVSDSNQM